MYQRSWCNHLSTVTVKRPRLGVTIVHQTLAGLLAGMRNALMRCRPAAVAPSPRLAIHHKISTLPVHKSSCKSAAGCTAGHNSSFAKSPLSRREQEWHQESLICLQKAKEPSSCLMMEKSIRIWLWAQRPLEDSRSGEEQSRTNSKRD